MRRITTRAMTFSAVAALAALVAGTIGTATAGAAQARPVISLQAQHIAASELDGPTDATVTLQLSRKVRGRVRINLVITGSARNGRDFMIAERVTVPAGATTVELPLHIKKDGENEATETFEVRIGRTTNNVSVDRASAVTGTIADMPRNPAQPFIQRAELCPDRTYAFVQFDPAAGHDPASLYEVELRNAVTGAGIMHALLVPGANTVTFPIASPVMPADNYLITVYSFSDAGDEYSIRRIADGPCTN